MNELDWKPWDSPGTFGKRLYNPAPGQTHLCQWPLKLSKVSNISPYFHKAHLMIAADCSAYSYMRFHQALLRGRLLTIGCPDIEGEALFQKIREVIRLNDIQSIRLVRMDAPCCHRIADAVIMAIKKSGKDIPLQITTVFAEGENVEG
jgi:hypothetical protein